MNMRTVTLTSPEIWNLAQAKAAQLRMSVDEYVSRIVKSHIASKEEDPWGPVPKEVSQRWDREEAEFEAEERKHPHPVFTSGADYVEYIRKQS